MSSGIGNVMRCCEIGITMLEQHVLTVQHQQVPKVQMPKQLGKQKANDDKFWGQNSSDAHSTTPSTMPGAEAAARVYLKGEFLVLRLCYMRNDSGLVQVMQDVCPIPQHKDILPILAASGCPLEEGHHACRHHIC